jgi:hypothetical protein
MRDSIAAWTLTRGRGAHAAGIWQVRVAAGGFQQLSMRNIKHICHARAGVQLPV